MRIRMLALAPAAVAALAIAAPTAAVAQTSSTSLKIKPAFVKNKAGARTNVDFTLTNTAPGGALPLPLKQIVAHTPAGMGVNTKGLALCTAQTLNTQGPSACPASSLVGTGDSIAAADIGGTLIKENASIRVFLAPPVAGGVGLNFYAVGTTPIALTIVIPASLTIDTPPYGFKLVSDVPPIPTVPGGPDASILSLHVRLGANRVTVPSACPSGGFRWAGGETFVDGTTTAATATSPCPSGAKAKQPAKKKKKAHKKPKPKKRAQAHHRKKKATPKPKKRVTPRHHTAPRHGAAPRRVVPRFTG